MRFSFRIFSWNSSSGVSVWFVLKLFSSIPFSVLISTAPLVTLISSEPFPITVVVALKSFHYFNT